MAIVPCISIGLWFSRGITYVWSTFTSACASAFSGSPAACLGRTAHRLVRLHVRRQNGLTRLTSVSVCGSSCIGDAHQRRGVARLFQRFSDDERNRLALMAYSVVLQHVQTLTYLGIGSRLVRAIREPRRVAMRQHSDDAGKRSAAALSIDAMRPLAIVLRTMAACATFGTSNSAAYVRRPSPSAGRRRG